MMCHSVYHSKIFGRKRWVLLRTPHLHVSYERKLIKQNSRLEEMENLTVSLYKALQKKDLRTNEASIPFLALVVAGGRCIYSLN